MSLFSFVFGHIYISDINHVGLYDAQGVSGRRSITKITDEEITRLTESIAGSIGCSMEELYNQPLKDIFRAMNADYTNRELFELIKRLAKEVYIPHSYIDEAHALLFSRP